MKSRSVALLLAVVLMVSLAVAGAPAAQAAGVGRLPKALLETAEQLAAEHDAARFLVYDVDGDGSGELTALYCENDQYLFCRLFGLDRAGNAVEIFSNGGELLAGSPDCSMLEVNFEGAARLAYRYHNFSGTAIEDYTIFVPSPSGSIQTHTLRAEEDVAGDVGYSLYWQDGAEISTDQFHAIHDNAVDLAGVWVPGDGSTTDSAMEISQLTATYGTRQPAEEPAPAEVAAAIPETGVWEVYQSDYNQILFQPEAHRYVATIDLLEAYGSVVGTYSEDSSGRIDCQVEYKNFGEGYSDDPSTSFVLQRSGTRLDVPSQVWYLYPGQTVFYYDRSFTVEPESGTGTTTADVNFRSGPGTDYFNMVQLYAGLPMVITGRVGDWYRVEYRVGEHYTPGFINAAYVKMDRKAASDAGEIKERPAEGVIQTPVPAAGSDANYELLRDYWTNSVGLSCPGVLGDVDRDGQDDLVYVDDTDGQEKVRGYVLTVKNGAVRSTLVEEAVPAHVDGYFNLFVRLNSDGTADLINYKDAMYQGYGGCAYTVFHLDENGNKVETDSLSVSNNGSSPVSSEQLDRFNSSGGELIRGTTCLYTSGLEGLVPFDGVVFPQETAGQLLEKALS